MNIRITPANAARIEDMLASVNGIRVDYAYTLYSEIEGVAEDAEIRLASLFIPQNQREGAIYKTHSMGPLEHPVTSLTLERRRNGWHIIDACQVEYAPISACGVVELTPEQDEAAVRMFRGMYKVRQIQDSPATRGCGCGGVCDGDACPMAYSAGGAA